MASTSASTSFLSNNNSNNVNSSNANNAGSSTAAATSTGPVVLVNTNLHLVSSLVSFIQIHREFIVAGLRSPALVQATLKQLPAAMKKAVEEFNVQLRERIAAAGLLYAAASASASPAGSAASGSPDSNNYSERLGLKSPTRSFIFGNNTSGGSSASSSPNFSNSYTPEQQEHLTRFRVALIGCPDRRCDPKTEDDILPNPPIFGLSQGDPKRLKQFLSMPCNSDLVAFLHAKLGGGTAMNNAEANLNGTGNSNNGNGDLGGGGGDDLMMMGGPMPMIMTSFSSSSSSSVPVYEALQFAATMWIQRYPSDPAAQMVEQQRCRKAGVVFSHHDVLRLLQEEHAHFRRVKQQESDANASRSMTQQQQPDGEGTDSDAEGGGDAGEASNTASTTHYQSASNAILLPKLMQSQVTMGSLNPVGNAQKKHQQRLERQKRQLLLCNLRLHFPDDAAQWTLMLASRDECLHELQDERVDLERMASELSQHYTSSSNTSNSSGGANAGSKTSQTSSSSSSSSHQQQHHPLVQAFVKLTVVAENACNGLQHNLHFNATPTDISDLFIAKLSPIVIECKLLKATLLSNAASAAAVVGKDLDGIKTVLDAQIAAEEEAAAAAAKKRGTLLGFFSKNKDKGNAAGGGAAADGAVNTTSGVSTLELTALYHVEALASVANKCLRAIQQPTQ